MFQLDNGSETEAWTTNNPADADAVLCYNMTKVGNYLYTVFSDTEAASIKVFRADTSAPSAGITWSDAITFANIPPAETVVDFSRVQDRLFVMTLKTGNLFSVYSAVLTGFDTNSAFSTIASDIVVGGELKSAFDGTSYWITAGNKLFKYNGLSTVSDETAAIKAASALLTGKGFSGIVCADTDAAAGTEIYVTSEEGVMLKYISGAWTVITSQYDTDNGLFEPLNDIAHIVISNTEEDIDIIIAASQTGYYEMEAAQSAADKTFVSAEKINTNLTTYNQFSSIELSNQIILGFYFDDTPSEEKVYALGYNAGLWKNSLKGTAEAYYRFWDIE